MMARGHSGLQARVILPLLSAAAMTPLQRGALPAPKGAGINRHIGTLRNGLTQQRSKRQ